MDLKWQLALLSMRARRECKSHRNQESRPRNQEISRNTVNVEDTSSEAMVAIYEAGFNCCYMADDEVPTNMALMAFLDLEKSNLYSTRRMRTDLVFTSYNVVAPSPTGLFSPPTIDLSNSDLEEFQHPKFKGYGPKDSKSVCLYTSNDIKKATDYPIIEDYVSNSDEDESKEMVLKSDNVQHKPEQAN
nr:hypothetical protein [Tanacetum cinerariifolium]